MAESLQIRREIIYDKIEYFFKPFFEFFPEFFYFGHFSNFIGKYKKLDLGNRVVEGLYFADDSQQYKVRPFGFCCCELLSDLLFLPISHNRLSAKVLFSDN